MESGEIELDQALALYQEGTELMARCQAALQDVQRSIKKLTRDGQG
ncbi:exodeoxyribonuclease VII small subunit, partial [bacterium]|nr:exodeoxyribonuclease VII small subunit [bacterium]